MPRTRRRGLAVVSGTLFTLAVGVSAVFAARSTGEPVHEIALGDDTPRLVGNVHEGRVVTRRRTAEDGDAAKR